MKYLIKALWNTIFVSVSRFFELESFGFICQSETISVRVHLHLLNLRTNQHIPYQAGNIFCGYIIYITSHLHILLLPPIFIPTRKVSLAVPFILLYFMAKTFLWVLVVDVPQPKLTCSDLIAWKRKSEKWEKNWHDDANEEVKAAPNNDTYSTFSFAFKFLERGLRTQR